MSSTISRVLRLLGCGLLLLAATEGLVRLLGVAPPKPKIYADSVYQPDPHLPYRQQPGISRSEPSRTGEFVESFSHNSAGFRDVEHEFPKSPGTFRILALGGSVTYGSGVSFEETYLARLEKDLNGRGGLPPVEIVKAGVGGFFPAAERLLLEHYGLAYRPDLVLLQIDDSDAFESFLGVEGARVTPGLLKTADMRALGLPLGYLAVNTHIGRILYHRWSRSRLAHLRSEFSRQEPQVWEGIEHEIERMKRLAAGAGLVVLYIPVDLKLEHPHPLRAICRRLELPCTDATPFLLDSAREGPVIWERDGHPNARGHAAVARAVETFLLAQGLLR